MKTPAARSQVSKLKRERDDARAEVERLRKAGAAILRYVFDSGIGASAEAEAALAVFARHPAPKPEAPRMTDEEVMDAQERALREAGLEGDRLWRAMEPLMLWYNQRHPEEPSRRRVRLPASSHAKKGADEE